MSNGIEKTLSAQQEREEAHKVYRKHIPLSPSLAHHDDEPLKVRASSSAGFPPSQWLAAHARVQPPLGGTG
jgi:hypothetical protein